MPRGRGGKAFRSFLTGGKARSSAGESGKTLRSELANKCADMLQCFFRYIISTGKDLLEEIICRMLPVKELPQVDTRGTMAKTTTGIGVEENRPVVKLLTEHDVRIGYRFVMLGHKGVSSSAIANAPNRAAPPGGI
jgi:hypothetical protein